METKLETNQWYVDLIDDCKTIITEAIFTSRWALVEGYWNLGKRIREDVKFQKYAKGNNSCLTDLSNKTGVGYRDIYRSLQLFDKYPELQQLPEGKNITWNKLITKYLPAENKPILPLPEGKYQVIYMDLPWKYDVDLSSGATRSPENNYSVMDLKEIKDFGLKVRELATENCVLFMWITAPKLNWMNDVLEACGFEYKTNLIWDKIKPNMGHYSSVRHEILIIAGKGNCSPTCDGKIIQSIDSVQSIEKSSKHSEKPTEFVDIIDKLYPNYKKIELFARNKDKRKNWEYWGNEAKT